MSSITFRTIKYIIDTLDSGGSEDSDLKKLKSMGINYIDATKGGASIVKLTQDMLVEPSFVISKSLRTDENTIKVLKVLTNLFTGYYIQAFNVLANLKGIEPTTVIDVLGSVSTESEDNEYEGICLDLVSTENLPFSLPIKNTKETTCLFEASLESSSSSTTVPVKTKKEKVGASLGKLDEKMNLVLGRTFDVTVNTKNAVLSIPIVVKAGVKYTELTSIFTLMNLKGKSKRFRARLDSWRSGGIEFFKDFIFASDLIHQYKKARLTGDDEKVIEDASDRARQTVAKYVKSGKASFGGLYSGLIINEAEATQLEAELGGKLTDFKTRQEAMVSSQSLFIVVIDRDWERASFYTRDLKGYSDVPFSELKGSDSKDGIMEIFKSFSSGVPPTL